MIKGEYLKVLNFRDELINLLNKYDFDFYADNKDNGDMIIDTGRQYIMSGSNRNYSISDVINNNNLIEEYIKETFIGSQQHEFCNGNHSNYYCGIFTNDSCKADEIMNKIYKDNKDNIIRFVKGENDKYILLKDETIYKWVRPILNSRGYRFKSAYIDRELTKKVLDEVVFPILCLYAGENNIKVF